MNSTYEPDYRNFLTAVRNQRPRRLPLYEHVINSESMEGILDISFAEGLEGDQADRRHFFESYCGFYRQMTYDTVSYEVCVTEMLPGGGALLGQRPGPIQNRSDFEQYPWSDLPRLFWEFAAPKFEMFSACLPPGMKGVGGVGNGVFEISEDLVGFQQLCYLQVDDPELFAELYVKIGDLLITLWSDFLQRFGDSYCVARIGDDMGFKTSTLMAPQTLKQHVVPQYRRIIKLIHQSNYPFLLHSCGCIFDVMDDLIAAGIDAKHSNEDAIAPFDNWIERYSDRIALLGGFDTDLLCRLQPQQITDLVLEKGAEYRNTARGYALGSGNSIPPYVRPENYLAMIHAAQQLRSREQAS